MHALTTKPDHHLGHYAKGFLHRTRGEHEEALAAFTETLKHSPNFARAHAQRGAELIYLGRPRKASPRSKRRFRSARIARRSACSSGSSAAPGFSWANTPRPYPGSEKSVRLWPNLWYNRLYLVSAYALGEKGGGEPGAQGVRQALSPLDSRAGYEGRKNEPEQQRVYGQRPERLHDALLSAGMAAK